MSELARELVGTQCRCGRAKGKGKTFCYACYRALPLRLQRELYRRMGEGYEEAYAEAVGILRGDAKALELNAGVSGRGLMLPDDPRNQV